VPNSRGIVARNQCGRGHACVPVTELQEMMTSPGWTSPDTWLNSANMLFSTGGDDGEDEPERRSTDAPRRCQLTWLIYSAAAPLRRSLPGAHSASLRVNSAMISAPLPDEASKASYGEPLRSAAAPLRTSTPCGSRCNHPVGRHDAEPERIRAACSRAKPVQTGSCRR